MIYRIGINYSVYLRIWTNVSPFPSGHLYPTYYLHFCYMYVFLPCYILFYSRRLSVVLT